ILLVGYSPRFFRGAILQALGTGRPLLFRAETKDHARSRSWIKSWVRDRLLSALYRRCARLLFVGQRSRPHYLGLGFAEQRLIFSPYCVDTVSFQPDDSARDRLREPTRNFLGISANQKMVLFSGKLSRRKGVDVLVQAVRRLPAHVRQQIVLVF